MAVGSAEVLAAALYGAGGWVAGRAALDRRALRRARDDLADRVALLTRLDRATTPEDTCRAVAEHVVANLGFSRCVALLQAPTRVVGARADGATSILVAAPVPQDQPVAGWAEAGRRAHAPALRAHLDPDGEPLLTDLLPGAVNVVAVALQADGTRLGVVVGEWGRGPRARFPHEAGRRLIEDTAHAGASLRAVLLREQVEQRSRRDLLTGLSNRRGFDEALDRELDRCARTGTPLGVVLLDLDHFKEVNDTLGHQVGDGVLAAAGRAIGAAGRGHDLAARIGGDEFALLAPGAEAPAAEVLAERARHAVASAVGRHGVSASVGVAAAPRQGNTRGAVVRAADAALYAAKSAGRDRVVVSDRDVPRLQAGEPVRWEPRRRRIQPSAPGLGTGRVRDARPA